MKGSVEGSVEGRVEWRLSVDCVQIAVAWAHTKAAFCANADGDKERGVGDEGGRQTLLLLLLGKWLRANITTTTTTAVG